MHIDCNYPEIKKALVDIFTDAGNELPDADHDAFCKWAEDLNINVWKSKHGGYVIRIIMAADDADMPDLVNVRWYTTSAESLRQRVNVKTLRAQQKALSEVFFGHD